MGETGARRRNRNGARRTCDATHSSTREIMRASSPRARACVGVNHVRASSARARGVDGGRTLRAATTEVSLNREGLVSSRGARDGARALVQTRAIDPAGAISAVQGFVLDGSPGLRAAAIANTAVFTSGFGVLRLGLTLAGIAHSWFLGTVRDSPKTRVPTRIRFLCHECDARTTVGGDDRRQILPSARNADRQSSDQRRPLRERVSKY